jgi:hypothetical protein
MTEIIGINDLIVIREANAMTGIIGINDLIVIREANAMTEIRGMMAIHVGMGADPVIMRKRIGERGNYC